MSDTAIVVEGLGKRYQIGQREPYGALRDVLMNALRGKRRAASDMIWALKDASFEIKQGEVVGIIGRNGAGKSTLLKILSRITKPTEGKADIWGRVGSLLEVGTGFHPELTGQENIFLNGAILGMRKAEIARKFDEIVAFAETEQFLDTPVKHYSSGMRVRLAFAVAAHLEPEILLVDEVLAVGDAAFQKKCLGKMGDVAKAGRTILFVSHNMAAVRSLTHKCLYLAAGRIAARGESGTVVDQYVNDALERRRRDNNNLDYYRRDFLPDTPVKICELWLNDSMQEEPCIEMGAAFTIRLRLDVSQPIRGANITVFLKNSIGERVALLFSADQNFAISLTPGRHVLAVQVDDLKLAPGTYLVDVGINQSIYTRAYEVVVDVPLFRVTNDATVPQWTDRPWGTVYCDQITWTIEQ